MLALILLLMRIRWIFTRIFWKGRFGFQVNSISKELFYAGKRSHWWSTFFKLTFPNGMATSKTELTILKNILGSRQLIGKICLPRRRQCTILQLSRNICTLFRKPGDCSNFTRYPDSGTLPPNLKPSEDPFVNWWLFIYINFLYSVQCALKLIASS